MYLKYIKKDEQADKNGMLEVGKFYKVLSCTATTLFVLDDADEKVEIPMINMGVVPEGSKVRLVNDLLPCEKKGNVGFIQSSIKSLVGMEKAPSISYFFVPVDNEEECYPCDREDFEVIH